MTNSVPKSTVQEGIASRKLALETLIKIENDKAYAKLALNAAFKRKSLVERDRAFVTALVQGVVRHLAILDDDLGKISKQPLSKMPPSLRNILRMAIFQLKFMPDIPSSAVINTAVELVKKTGHKGQIAFANGVLRNYARQSESKSDSQPEAKYAAPDWLVEKWNKRWGKEEADKLLAYCQEIPQLMLKTCEMSISPEGLKSILEAKGMRLRHSKLVSSCLIIEDRGKLKGPLSKLPGYDDGLFTVQDEAAAFASAVVDPKPGEVVIDLCAAPGGKSINMAELMENKGRVIALDSHVGRLKLLKQTRNRLGLTNIEIAVGDGRSYALDVLADRVLVDAPCSGTGVINRRADLWLNRTPPDMVNLVDLQKQLLDNASKLVKPGGILVYSTCSMEPEENEEMIKWFLENHTNFQGDSLEPFVAEDVAEQWTKNDSELNLKAGWLQLLPSRHGVSGFFVARLKRLS